MITRTTRSIGWGGGADLLCLHDDGRWKMYIMTPARIQGGKYRTHRWHPIGRMVVERVASVFPDIKLEVMRGPL